MGGGGGGGGGILVMPIYVGQIMFDLSSFSLLLPSSSLPPSLPPCLLPRLEMPTDPNDCLTRTLKTDGVNDPVVEKLLTQASDMPMLSAPDDTGVSLHCTWVEWTHPLLRRT